MLRCRTDWRVAAVAAISDETVVLSVCSPSGYTYRLRRAPDIELVTDGAIALLGSGTWRGHLARYDYRW